MAKGRPPPAFLQKGKAAAPPARGSMGRAPPAPPPRRAAPPPMAPDPTMDPTAGAPVGAFRRGGKVKR